MECYFPTTERRNASVYGWSVYIIGKRALTIVGQARTVLHYCLYLSTAPDRRALFALAVLCWRVAVVGCTAAHNSSPKTNKQRKSVNIVSYIVLLCCPHTVLSHEVAMTMLVGDCSVPFTDNDEIPSCGGLGNLTSPS